MSSNYYLLILVNFWKQNGLERAQKEFPPCNCAHEKRHFATVQRRLPKWRKPGLISFGPISPPINPQKCSKMVLTHALSPYQRKFRSDPSIKFRIS